MIGSASFAESARTVPTAFTRKRLLPLPHLVTFLINGPRAGLQPELAAFFDHALESDRVQAPTKSAFCQARSQLRPTAIRTLVIASGQALLRHCEAERWHGLRVLALDGSTLRTAESPECAEYFGGMQPRAGDFCPIARVSALFDVARDSFVDAVLGKYSDDERSLALDHLDQLGPTDLVVMDRGYPSRNLLAEFSRRGAFWCVRMTTSWKVVKRFARSDRIDALVDLGTPESPLPSRLLRVVLPNGSVFILATNVLDPAFSPSAFADLYHGRWRIEEAFKLIKARLQVENWSGVLPHTVEQDFYATLVRANCAAALALAARPEEASLSLPAPNETGWRVQINRTLVLKSLRHHVVRLLLLIDFDAILSKLITRLRSPSALERTRPDRTAKRTKKARLAGFHFAYKAA